MDGLLSLCGRPRGAGLGYTASGIRYNAAVRFRSAEAELRQLLLGVTALALGLLVMSCGQNAPSAVSSPEVDEPRMEVSSEPLQVTESQRAETVAFDPTPLAASSTSPKASDESCSF